MLSSCSRQQTEETVNYAFARNDVQSRASVFWRLQMLHWKSKSQDLQHRHKQAECPESLQLLHPSQELRIIITGTNKLNMQNLCRSYT
eukprot:scaffold293101_cov18-Tisochrysis_lutea.AAC.1